MDFFLISLEITMTMPAGHALNWKKKTNKPKTKHILLYSIRTEDVNANNNSWIVFSYFFIKTCYEYSFEAPHSI